MKQLQKPRWPTSKSMQALLAPVPHLYQVNGKAVPPGESWQCTTKIGHTYQRVNPKHSGRLNFFVTFYKYQSTSGRQNRKRETRICTRSVLSAKVAYMRHWYVIVEIFQSRVHVKLHVQVRYTIASTPTKNCLFIMIVLKKNFSCCGEKRSGQKIFLLETQLSFREASKRESCKSRTIY